MLVTGLCFQILILFSLTESIIQPKPFPKDFCMFDIIDKVQTDWNASSMSLSLIIVSAFECKEMCHILFYHQFLSL